MKKVISAIIACIFIMAMASSVAVTSFAAISPIAPTIDETTTKTPPTEKPTEEPTEKPTSRPTDPSETTTLPDVDETTTSVDESTTKKPVTSDTNPSSPDTGSYVGKTVSVAALVAVALGGAVVYTSKKKAE